LFIASIAAVVSYRDGLFVARLAGNHDDQAYLYPFLPDGLLVVRLLALYEASRAKVKRSRWAMGGLVLGISLTLAQNVYAGLAHTVLDAVLDGMVPVVFFIAVEVVLWHVKRGRGAYPRGTDSQGSPATGGGAVPSSVLEAAEASMAATVAAGNPWSVNGLRERFPLTRKQAADLHRKYVPKDPPAGILPPAGAQDSPAGNTGTAGDSGRDARTPQGVLAAPFNGRPS